MDAGPAGLRGTGCHIHVTPGGNQRPARNMRPLWNFALRE